MRKRTYTRDSFTGLDYADQRFYASSYGRFNTADPYQASAGAAEPGSWNRYSYVEGDPVNWTDRTGMAKESEQAKVDFQSAMMNPFLYWLMGRGYGGSSEESNASGGGGGGNGGRSSSPMPDTGTKTLKAIECASEYAKSNSIASVFGIWTSNTVGQAVLGNSVAGVADIFLSVFGDKVPEVGDALSVLGSGITQGLSTSNSTVLVGPLGQVGNFVQKVVAQGLSGLAASSPVGLAGIGATTLSQAANSAKLAFDAVTFLAGFGKCWH